MPAIAELSAVDLHRLNRLLEVALALDEDKRSDWLSHLPDADADLVPLVERLLSATDRTETAECTRSGRSSCQPDRAWR